MVITLYPSMDKVTVEARKDGGWNLHNEYGVSTWNVPEEEVERLIKVEATAAQREVNQRAAEARRLAQQVADDYEAAMEENKKYLRAKYKGIHGEVAPATADYETHVADTPSLTAYVELSDDSFDALQSWYLEVTGEELSGDETWLRRVRGRNGWEPRVHCEYHEGARLPHPVVVRPDKPSENRKPQFLLLGFRTLENNYQEYFAGILKAGFRP
jgi:hypothetical protein